MHWLLYFAISLVTAVLGLVGGGWIGSVCVRWYRISNFEGGSGYFVIGIALLGALVGLVTGLVMAGFLAPVTGADYLKSAGWSSSVVLGMAAIVLVLCWVLADIPPSIDGRKLTLEIELRLPSDFTESPANGTGASSLGLSSLVNQRVRMTEYGEIRPADARLEGGRWVVPGSVALVTTIGQRLLEIQLHGAAPVRFVVPLPAKPGSAYLEWSPWEPRPPAPTPPWPESKASFRFRLRKVEPPPPGPTAEDHAVAQAAVKQAEFDAIVSATDTTLSAWFPYVGPGAREDHRATALSRMVARPLFVREMLELMVGEGAEQAAEALRLIEHLPPEMTVNFVEPTKAVGQDLVERIRKVNATTAEQDPSYLGAAEASVRFNAWMAAVRSLRERGQGDFVAELGAILELSRVRPDSHVMRQDICRVASFYLHEWAGVAPLPTDPKPR